MAEIAGVFISPLLQVCFEKIASSKYFKLRRKINDELLMKLKLKLECLIPVVEDAEGKQFMNTAVKKWLDRVKEVVYDAEDILDVIATEDLRRELEAEFETPSGCILNTIVTWKSQVCTTFSTSSSVKEVESKVGELLERLEFLVQQKENLGLRADVGGKALESAPTTSLVDESSIFGRNDDKDEIINSLLSDGASGDGMGVIALVGMGGIGKTTLAKLVYNDHMVKDHFDHKAWVCVSEDFDVLKLTKTILEEIGLRDDSDNLNQLQIKLKEKLTGKKILIVLDDVWNIELTTKWGNLSEPFKYDGAQDSRVLVTTRDAKVALVMSSPSKIHCIAELPKEYCWMLFEKCAFKNLDHYARQQRKELAIQILEKCKGIPLAIKAIGSFLRSEPNFQEWVRVSKSELWHLPSEIEILPALSLSYKYLSSYLKRCFAYCAIFPKDYAFERDTVVSLWIAEGFLLKSQNKTIKEVGDDYFRTLVSRSLFQSYSNGDKFIMHDLVNDLAKFISGQFTLSRGDDYSCEIGSNTRHFSRFSYNFCNNEIEALHSAKKLRSFVSLGYGGWACNATELLKLRYLRVLINILPYKYSIEELILLRHLEFSSNDIKRLPDSICKLYNLQILNLSNCWSLVALPTDLHKLINLQILNLNGCSHLAALPSDVHELTNLHHLDITKTAIMEMPINLGNLKCLQTLPTFIVSKRSGFGTEELGKLRNLRGSLSVLELQNIESPAHAKDVNLRDKYLEELELKWRVDTASALESHKIVLHFLEPHSILRSLCINGYCGTSFPNWVGDASFSNIASLRLEYCTFCYSLPPLGQLPSLQDLSIVGLDGVVTAGGHFYSSGSSSMRPFGALKYLRFEDMLQWKEWFPFEAENEGGAFPNLRELCISKCPKLTGELPVHLPSLVELSIRDCPKLVASLPGTSSGHKVTLSNCNTIISNESSIGINALSIENCSMLEFPMHLNYSTLECLTLKHCSSLKSFPLFSKIREMVISNCGDLESLTVGEQHEHDLLFSVIDIAHCPNFAYFPQGGLRAPNLKDFEIRDCRSLRSLPDKMHMLLPSLETLYINDCPQVESFPEGGLPSNLNKIFILNCDKLFANRMGWGLQNLSCLRRFSIINKSVDVESFPDEALLPTSLTYLSIDGFPNLKSLEKKGFQHLTALEELVIWHCPKLEFMPEDGLPAYLSTIHIRKCPLLTKELERKEGPEWCKIAHVPKKLIY